MPQRILLGLTIALLTASFTGNNSSASPLEDRLAAPTKGEWSLKILKDGAVVSLEYSQWLSIPNEAIETASFTFVCDRRNRSGEIEATLFPFEGSYNNQQDEVPVLIERSSNPSDDAPLFQKWLNGYKYIYLHPRGEVTKLVEYFKNRQTKGTTSVDVIFSGDFSGGTEKLLRIGIVLTNFSEAFSRFQSACTVPQTR
jgi:hypothetical protein